MSYQSAQSLKAEKKRQISKSLGCCSDPGTLNCACFQHNWQETYHAPSARNQARLRTSKVSLCSVCILPNSWMPQQLHGFAHARRPQKTQVDQVATASQSGGRTQSYQGSSGPSCIAAKIVIHSLRLQPASTLRQRREMPRRGPFHTPPACLHAAYRKLYLKCSSVLSEQIKDARPSATMRLVHSHVQPCLYTPILMPNIRCNQGMN